MISNPAITLSIPSTDVPTFTREKSDVTTLGTQASPVGVKVGVSVGKVPVIVGVAVKVLVGVKVGVSVGRVPVIVGVAVKVLVGVKVGVSVGRVPVAVGVAVKVLVGVKVAVGVAVWVSVGVSVKVLVAVWVAVNVGVAVGRYRRTSMIVSWTLCGSSVLIPSEYTITAMTSPSPGT